MSERIKDGGPAFPAKRVEEFPLYTMEGELMDVSTHEVAYAGMTLRDYFAGQALAGLGIGFGEGDVQWFEQYGAKAAYRIADAMIAAREGGKQ